MSALSTAELQSSPSTDSIDLRWEIRRRDGERDSAIADWIAGQLETEDDEPASG